MQTTKQLRFLLLQVITPHYHQEDAIRNMRELEQLVETFGGEVIEKIVQHRVKPHPNTYIGPGKLDLLAQQVKEFKIDVVVFNDIVKQGQLFRVEKRLWDVNTQIGVWDRVMLILEIFDQHATTTEAKLQIELARMQQVGPRIYGLGRTELSRQGGGIGTRGKGETNIEFERRVAKKRIQDLQKKLDQLSHQKKQRIHNRFEQGMGPVSLVGYTSAGKTTLFNLLTGKQKQTHRGLFTTLDTVVGKMKITQNQLPVLISDTIGFIDQLPPVLIEAFKSTLLESMEALLILHVIDASDPQLWAKKKVVEQILKDLASDQPVLIVFNKIDLISKGQLIELQEEFKEINPLFISAKSGEGIQNLKKTIHHQLVTTMRKDDDSIVAVGVEI